MKNQIEGTLICRFSKLSFSKITINQLKEHLCLKKDIFEYNYGHSEIIFIKFAHPVQALESRFVGGYKMYFLHISPR
jgi:hypothetical protein